MLSRSLVLTTLLLIAGLETLSAQDIYVRIRGKVLNGDDSTTAVRASLLYEKLPYYDDMGKIANTADGDFEFYLIKDIAYNISINEGGFEPYSNQLQVVDADGDKSMDVNFYLKPVEVPEELEEEIFVLQNLIFTSGSDVIQRGSYPGLDEFVAWMKDRPSYVVQLEGHTDIAGNPAANMRLSQARVESVKEYITKKGVKKARVLTKAFGGTRPLSEERTDAAKRANRRVEVRVIGR